MNRKWQITEAQIAEAKQLRNMGGARPRCWRKIAKMMGISNHQLQMAMNENYHKDHRATGKPKPNVRMIVPQEVLDERERRRNAYYRSPYSDILGEPPVGYSALDRR